jgi:hypothetical protein
MATALDMGSSGSFAGERNAHAAPPQVMLQRESYGGPIVYAAGKSTLIDRR